MHIAGQMRKSSGFPHQLLGSMSSVDRFHGIAHNRDHERSRVVSVITHQSQRLRRSFDAYHSYHHHPLNQLMHFVGIPMVVLSFAGLLSWFSLGPSWGNGLIAPDLALIVWGMATLFYLWIDWPIGMPFSLVTLGFYICGRQMMLLSAWTLLWGIFIGGWILMLLGHTAFERRFPPLSIILKDILIGPLWNFARMVGYYRCSI